jgi:phage repressor protein C with HTH and peptisase S24 domain
MTSDPVRELIQRVIDARSLEMKELSEGIGRNHAYLFQFLRKGTPRRLTEDDRHKLATLLGVNESDLRHAPKLSTKPQASSVETTRIVRNNTDNVVFSNVGERSGPPPYLEFPRDLPEKGTAIGGGHGREDFRFNGDIVDYVRRPPRLQGVRDAFVVSLLGDSMEPRYRHGDKLYVHPGQHPKPGDDVLVELHPIDGEEAGTCMVKVLVSKTASKLRLKQYNPTNDKIEIDTRKVRSVFRIIPYGELLNN